MRTESWAALCFGLLVCLGCATQAEARITRIEIARTASPTFDARSFGTVGTYEKLAGRAYGEVDPKDPGNAVIVDLGNAPRNARGMIEYNTDFMILRPVDPAKANRRLWFEVNNRGSVPAFSELNDADTGGNDPSFADDAGNGFLMNQGYTILQAGWDATVPPGAGRFTIRVPVARNPDGSSIVGPALEEFVIDDARTRTGGLTYPAASLDKASAHLTMRVRYEDPPIEVPAADWDFTDKAGTAIKLASGQPFRQGMLYEFTYLAKDPIVAGLGLAAIRDVASFFRGAAADDAGATNPLAGAIDHVYTACSSQPCRTLHDFVRLGFNRDESGRRAIDGMVNWIGGATGIFLNYRFAQPGRTQRQHVGRWYPEFQPPFTNDVLADPATGTSDGRLRLCAATDTCPKIFEANSANEYWSKDMVVGQVNGGKDLPDAPGVRDYFVASFPHSPAGGSGICQKPRNPLEPNAVLRALLVAMDGWVSTGAEPPPSRMPRLADGTLVPPLPQAGQGFPAIPGVAYNGRMHTGDRLDFGPSFAEGILTTLPPRLLGTPYPALVPKTDADGNDIAGIRVPDVAVPLATYTGWALRAAPPGGDEGCDGAGQKIDFAATREERLAKGDPRPSLEERYPTHAGYVASVRAAAEALVSDRFLLPEDAAAYVARAEAAPVGNR